MTELQKANSTDKDQNSYRSTRNTTNPQKTTSSTWLVPLIIARLILRPGRGEPVADNVTRTQRAWEGVRSCVVEEVTIHTKPQSQRDVTVSSTGAVQ